MARYPVEVAYCTDVEGNLSYFEKWVETAGRVVRFDSEGKELELMHEGAYFVYGGDVCDNGPGDLRLCQLLVSLKKRHPDRVALLSGNRDLNKLRMTAELDLTDLDRPMDEIAKPHWDVNALTLRQHLERVATQKELPGGVDEANTRIERLKYMLQCTMGCPKTFEFRREELGLLREVPAAQVTDDEVFDSFLSGVTPGAGGVMRAYTRVMESATAWWVPQPPQAPRRLDRSTYSGRAPQPPRPQTLVAAMVLPPACAHAAHSAALHTQVPRVLFPRGTARQHSLRARRGRRAQHGPRARGRDALRDATSWRGGGGGLALPTLRDRRGVGGRAQ